MGTEERRDLELKIRPQLWRQTRSMKQSPKAPRPAHFSVRSDHNACGNCSRATQTCHKGVRCLADLRVPNRYIHGPMGRYRCRAAEMGPWANRRANLCRESVTTVAHAVRMPMSPSPPLTDRRTDYAAGLPGRNMLEPQQRMLLSPPIAARMDVREYVGCSPPPPRPLPVMRRWPTVHRDTPSIRTDPMYP